MIRSLRAAVVALLIVAPGAAPASTTDEFNRARNAFTFGNYREAIQILSRLLHPLRLRDADRIVEARQLLGVCHYFVRQYGQAEQQFERLLFLRPRHQLDPLLFPPPVIEFFEKVRERIKDKLARLHPEVKPHNPGPIYIERRVQRNHRLLAFFPFGVGQFQNGRPGKAAFFLSAQLGMLATNLISYGVTEAKRQPDGRFLPSDEGLARNLRIVQIASLSAFGALVLWGVVDALVEFRPEVVTERRLPARRRRDRSRRKTGRLQWTPWMAAGGGGLALGLNF